jgi:hypothetical protein
VNPPAAASAETFEVRRLQPLRSVSWRASRAARYTPDEILAAIRTWADRYGEPPAMVDWEPARARRLGQDWRAERYESDAWPTARMVSGAFSSFNAAVEQAGLVARRPPSRLRANLSDPAAVLEAIVEWTRLYGDVPTMADWDPVRARRLKQDWRIARYRLGDWPSVRSVAHHFGSLSAAIAAAGLIPRPRASQHADRRAERAANRHAIASLRAGDRRPGVSDLAGALGDLAAARKADDPVALHAALVDVAASALAWAQAVGSER